MSWVILTRSVLSDAFQPGNRDDNACSNARPYSSTIGRSKNPSRKAVLNRAGNRPYLSLSLSLNTLSSTLIMVRNIDVRMSTEHSRESLPQNSKSGQGLFRCGSMNGITKLGTTRSSWLAGGRNQWASAGFLFWNVYRSQHLWGSSLNRILLSVARSGNTTSSSSLSSNAHLSKASGFTPALRASSFSAYSLASEVILICTDSPIFLLQD